MEKAFGIAAGGGNTADFRPLFGESTKNLSKNEPPNRPSQRTFKTPKTDLIDDVIDDD